MTLFPHNLSWFIILFLTGILTLSCGISSQQEHSVSTEAIDPPVIEVTVEGLPEGTAFLIGSITGQRYKQDSAMVNESGEFILQSAEPYRQGHFLVYLPDKTTFQILIGRDQRFSLHTRSGRLIEDMEVKGCVDNEMFYRSLKYETEIQPKVNELGGRMSQLDKQSEQYAELEKQRNRLLAERKEFLAEIYRKNPNSFFTSFKKAGQNPEIRDIRNPDGSVDNRMQVYYYRTEFWDDVNFNDDRLLNTPVIINKLERYMNELTVQHADSIIQSARFLMDKVIDYPEYFKIFANWITLQYEPGKTSLMDGEAIYVYMIQNYFSRDQAFWADSMTVYGLQQRAAEMQASLIGRKGPDVEATDPDGNLRSIYEISDPYIVIYMYNPKCEHCMEETPKLVDFYRKWKNRGVEIYGIAVDTNDEEWKEYIHEQNMDWINVHDPTNRSIYGKYFVDRTPEIYVLNPARTIIAKNLKVFQIEEVINRDRS